MRQALLRSCVKQKYDYDWLCMYSHVQNVCKWLKWRSGYFIWSPCNTADKFPGWIFPVHGSLLVWWEMRIAFLACFDWCYQFLFGTWLIGILCEKLCCMLCQANALSGKRLKCFRVRKDTLATEPDGSEQNRRPCFELPILLLEPSTKAFLAQGLSCAQLQSNVCIWRLAWPKGSRCFLHITLAHPEGLEVVSHFWASQKCMRCLCFSEATKVQRRVCHETRMYHDVSRLFFLKQCS